jgi:hypothetical protein
MVKKYFAVKPKNVRYFQAGRVPKGYLVLKSYTLLVGKVRQKVAHGYVGPRRHAKRRVQRARRPRGFFSFGY